MIHLPIFKPVNFYFVGVGLQINFFIWHIINTAIFFK